MDGGKKGTGGRLVPFEIEGPAGPLEALLRLPPSPRGAAVIAHPHPLYGGTMHTKVVHRAARLLADRFGLAALRFNFRGVGASAGSHDGGPGEVDDLVAAARRLRQLQPAGPLVLSGFSFGSLRAIEASALLRPDLLLLLGVPLLRWDRSGVDGIAGIPVAWVQGEEDEFGGGELARATASRLGWELQVVPGADHFFTERLEAFEEAVAEGVASLLPDGR